MRLGLCTSVANTAKAIDIGYDYVVLSGSEVSALSDAAFAALENEVESKGIKVEAFNGLCPQSVDIAGTEYSAEIAARYLSRLAARGARLGVKNLGIGAPKSRCIPKGFDRRQAWSNGREFISIAADEAAKYGMVASIEELTYKYCNFINTLEESLVMSDEVNKENVPIIIDFFHLEADGTEAETAGDYVRYAYDIHISGIDTVNGNVIRPYVDNSDKERLEKVAKVLRKAGYNKTITLEPDAAGEHFEEKAEKALKVMREVFC